MTDGDGRDREADYDRIVAEIGKSGSGSDDVRDCRTLIRRWFAPMSDEDLDDLAAGFAAKWLKFREIERRMGGSLPPNRREVSRRWARAIHERDSENIRRFHAVDEKWNRS